MPIYLANDKYRATLRTQFIYSPADSTLAVTAIPANVPTYVVVGWNTIYETLFSVTGTSGTNSSNYALTGVTVVSGAGLTQNLPENSAVNCLNNEEFFNQYSAIVSSDILAGVAVGSAVNKVTITNSATGNPPIIAATGSDTNIDLRLTPKGSGVLTVPSGTYEANVTDDDDIPNKKYVDDNAGSSDGWIASDDTFVYASASTFTISGVDRTAIYTKGTRIKFTQTSAKYFVVVSSSFSTDTTVTVAVNTDYTIANAAITAPYYSYDVNPQGYPSQFNFTPTYSSGGGAFTNAPTTNVARYQVIGRMCFYYFDFTYHGTSGGTGNTLIQSLPIAPAYNGEGGGGRDWTNGNLLLAFSETSQIDVMKVDGTTAIANSRQVRFSITVHI